MYIAQNKVRIHDLDLAGRLYFPRQFRFVNDALEDFLASEGISFMDLFHHEDFIFVIVHCEADYFAVLHVADTLKVQINVEKIGHTSFTLFYHIYRGKALVGTAKTIHVCLSKETNQKIPIPEKLLKVLKKYQK